MADRDPDRIKQEIEGELEDLARNIDALAQKVNPSTIVHRTGERARAEITQVAHVLGSVVAPRDAASSPLSEQQRRRLLIAGGVALAGVAALVVLGARRSANKTRLQLTLGA
ncbi:DUF3618 domain-containing protein [Actinocorallia sp. API 0066]|uniref:DUF3618 domain-containing protein n=1 Tax=Actinocorallia sp. API 0066 TaxID=2896846 RepID=UPI001E3CFFF4|nr:DUF3618 domain-containing protein [Actinocorallia sp. API 0066]MCD0451400.1 DUF3618 domain-containing protein [Actinocorallia sp. API 0066]